MKDTLEALAEKALDEEFMDRVAIAVLPSLLAEHAYDLADAMLKEREIER